MNDHDRAQRSLDAFLSQGDPFATMAEAAASPCLPPGDDWASTWWEDDGEGWVVEDSWVPPEVQAQADRELLATTDPYIEQQPEEDVDEQQPQEVVGEQQQQAKAQAELNEWWNDPEALAAEHNAAHANSIPWAQRGPPPPGKGGPETWRGLTYRPNSGKWMKRGGKHLQYYNSLYKSKGASSSSSSPPCGKGASSSSSSPSGKGASSSSCKGASSSSGKGASSSSGKGASSSCGKGASPSTWAEKGASSYASWR